MSRRSSRIHKQSERLEKYFTITDSKKRKASEANLDEGGSDPASKIRQQYYIQNQWLPITHVDSGPIITRTLVPNPLQPVEDVPRHEDMKAAGAMQFRFKNLFTTPLLCSRSPLPLLKWGDAQDVWEKMRNKERRYHRQGEYLSRHPLLLSRMRSILLEWIIEVCEVYRLHRETLHLTIDFIDRYLSSTSNVQKSQLQLLGITALFIASKLEEIYPPKIADFAYVTDGACTEAEISRQELVMLKTLRWDLTPMTVNTWMSLYLQLLNHTTAAGEETCLSQPYFSGDTFVQIIRLLDLCLLDLGSLQFSYSVLAASALYHFSNETSTFKASGFSWDELRSCVSWMAPFAITIRESGAVHMKLFENVMYIDCHSIQTHTVTLDMLEKAQQRLLEVQTYARSSPDHKHVGAPTDALLTPPSSSHKHTAALAQT